jgi:hypothetical protein
LTGLYRSGEKKLAALPGFEPEISASKAGVLPLHYRAAIRGRSFEKDPTIYFEVTAPARQGQTLHDPTNAIIPRR